MKESDKQIITDVITQMINQDNRGTRLPIYYQIQDEKRIPTTEYHSDDYIWFYDGEEYDSIDDIVEYFKDQGEEFSGLDAIDLEMEDRLEELGCEKIYIQSIKTYSGMFLTEKSAENHLKNNRHHYGENARTYVFHAWRNQELEDFLNAVARSVGMEIKGN